LGDYRKLQLAGKHSFSREFFLPDQMTAQELGDHVYARCGGYVPRFEPDVRAKDNNEDEASSPRPPHCWVRTMENSFSDDIDISRSRDELVATVTGAKQPSGPSPLTSSAQLSLI
jgi:hypothetical protein